MGPVKMLQPPKYLLLCILHFFSNIGWHERTQIGEADYIIF